MKGVLVAVQQAHVYAAREDVHTLRAADRISTLNLAQLSRPAALLAAARAVNCREARG